MHPNVTSRMCANALVIVVCILLRMRAEKMLVDVMECGVFQNANAAQ